jgi:hypothetical protein
VTDFVLHVLSVALMWWAYRVGYQAGLDDTKRPPQWDGRRSGAEVQSGSATTASRTKASLKLRPQPTTGVNTEARMWAQAEWKSDHLCFGERCPHFPERLS